jgi:hypothetical protein
MKLVILLRKIKISVGRKFLTVDELAKIGTWVEE